VPGSSGALLRPQSAKRIDPRPGPLRKVAGEGREETPIARPSKRTPRSLESFVPQHGDRVDARRAKGRHTVAAAAAAKRGVVTRRSSSFASGNRWAEEMAGEGSILFAPTWWENDHPATLRPPSTARLTEVDSSLALRRSSRSLEEFLRRYRGITQLRTISRVAHFPPGSHRFHQRCQPERFRHPAGSSELYLSGGVSPLHITGRRSAAAGANSGIRCRVGEAEHDRTPRRQFRNLSRRGTLSGREHASPPADQRSVCSPT